jgi:hypothetical protein
MLYPIVNPYIYHNIHGVEDFQDWPKQGRGRTDERMNSGNRCSTETHRLGKDIIHPLAGKSPYFDR